jgi:hypothetical protein
VAAANWTGTEILMGLADHSGPDITARLLLALTVLYTQRPLHTTEERQQYVELASRLIDKVDPSTRTRVAGILCNHAAAPTEVCERLAPARLIAADDVTPANHRGANLHTHVYGADTDINTAISGDGDPVASAAPDAERKPEELGEAFFAANAAERRRLLAVLASSAGGENMPACGALGDGHESAKAAVGFATGTTSDRYRSLDAAAMEGRIGEFIREFERALGIPKTLCERILNDRSGEPMVIAAKAANMPIAVLQRILLLVNPAVSHSVRRVYDLTDLFHEIDQDTAARLMSSWRRHSSAAETAANLEPPARKPLAPRELPGTALRSRFGALAARVAGQDINARPDPGNVGRGDLRFR